MSFFSYSQSGEDMILRALLEANKVDVKKGGFYVDVGAHHPKRFSNTMFFYELGWKGINIDPNEGTEDLFSKSRPRDKTIEIALGEQLGNHKFYTYDESALNSLNNRDIELADTPYIPSGSKMIQVSTLKNIITQFFPDSIPYPNFLDVDVEGLELAVLKGNDWNKFRFSFILVEQKLSSFALIINCPVTKYLEELGYEPIAHCHLTTIFRHSSI